MRILRLYIQDCGVFEQTLIDFTHQGKEQDILCISGVNGTGKTTVIELISNLIHLLNLKISSTDILYDRLKPNILTRVKFAQLDILMNEKIISLVVGDPKEIQKDQKTKLEQSFIIEPELSSLILEVENTILKIPEEISQKKVIADWKELKDEQAFSQRATEQQNIKPFQGLLNEISQSENKANLLTDTKKELPFIYFFNAHDREIQDIRYDSIPNQKPRYNLVNRYHPKRDDLKKILIYYDYAYPEEFENLKIWINNHVLVGKSIEKIDRPNFNVLIKAKNNQYHGLELLSSGEESLLIIATQIYLKAHKNAIFIIDEIDQSLHPEFQQKVIALIKNLQQEKKCQIIISSHSKIIWRNFDKKGLIDLTEMVL